MPIILIHMFAQLAHFFLFLSLTTDSLYLYNTNDNISVEIYDCITDTNLPYCRRPSEPIVLQRDQSVWYCDNGGISHSFSSLLLNNISVSTVLHRWNSSIEKAEEYSYYRKKQRSSKPLHSKEQYLCECKHPQSFGKHCEYLLPMGTTFEETVAWEVEMKDNIWETQRYSDIVCYTTLVCDSGLLCLDWRDICDGVQQCMFGYDEENCDKLEFNECEDDEYRCVNGMCIPDEYFLDGEYDCLDLTDEIEPFDDELCAFKETDHECDDRMCHRSDWSCGDGQCIEDRLNFHSGITPQCFSRREQYHMCELQYFTSQWTLPNGKCYGDADYEENVVKNRTASDECIYLIKCALSRGREKNCPCGRRFPCINEIKNSCVLPKIQYPVGAILGPYVFSFYMTTRYWPIKKPDSIKIEGAIKCRGYMSHVNITQNYSSPFSLQKMEAILCTTESNISALTDVAYDKFCHNNSRTFNNRLINFLDVCDNLNECISAYRINDGYRDCFLGTDERRSDLIVNFCSNIQHHRYQCSEEYFTCIPVNKLSERSFKCRNGRDDWWLSVLSQPPELVCNTDSKKDCALFRQHFGASRIVDRNDTIDRQVELSKIPFRFFCDTFWDWILKKDEDIAMCKSWWICLENQWQCRTGQCINIEWVLDGEWDCVDASDEEGIFYSIDRFFLRNLNLINMTSLSRKFNTLYKRQPFWERCNLTIEYPCFRANLSDPLNITENRPCINMNQIGDEHVDCAGGIDERNTLKNCDSSNMLGYELWCAVNKTCTSYWSRCPETCQENLFQCYSYKQTSNCSEERDFMCLNRTCVKDGWCNRHYDCSYGEDELFCLERVLDLISDITIYRLKKENSAKTTKQILQLSQLSLSMNENRVATTTPISVFQNQLTATNFSITVNSSIPYYCNRGIGVYLYNRSIICFCPPQYYGDKCQFHNDRIIVVFHLNLSQSIYVETHKQQTILTLLAIFLNGYDPLVTESFQIQVVDEIRTPRKRLFYFFYSRSNVLLKHKRARYFNRSSIINEHPYSVRFELYELSLFEKARLVGVWLYPIYFDFLPSFLFAKVLYLTKPDPINNPCFSNPCSLTQECHQNLREKSSYVCLCPPNFKGTNCSIIDQMCEEGHCSSNALCKPTHRGLLNGNNRPYCICPLNEIGDRCKLIHDQCHSNPCQNNGTCRSTPEPNRFICLCGNYHYGDQCQIEKRSVRLEIKKSPTHRAAVVQYFDINFYSLNLLLVHQRVYVQLSDMLHFAYDMKIAPGIVVVKLYSSTVSDIYLISVQIDVESIYGTIELNESNRCQHVQTLFPVNEVISPFKYHYLCNQNQSLLCFMDDFYLCICEENHSRTECFGYDYSLDQCSSCLSGGQCLKDDRWRSDFLCLCPRCYYGSSCQFNIAGISFTLDSLLLHVNRITQILYFGFVLIIFVVGGIFNYANLITFKRVNLQKTSIGRYMLVLSLTSQYSLFSLLMKMILILFDFLMNDISCKIISYMLSISVRCSFWLTSWIAIERVCYVLFPYGTLFKNLRVMTITTFSTILIVGIMHIHEVIFYMKLRDISGRSACVVDFSLKVRTYDRITVLIHYLIPFGIQIFSITVLIILAARSRSRTGKNRDTYIQYLKRQFQSQKELYITPLIIVLSVLPQTILSFSFACLELITWQQHTLIIAYFLSFTPQLLGFILFVFPSTNYMKEFQATELSKTIIFRWILLSKKA